MRISVGILLALGLIFFIASLVFFSLAINSRFQQDIFNGLLAVGMMTTLDSIISFIYANSVHLQDGIAILLDAHLAEEEEDEVNES